MAHDRSFGTLAARSFDTVLDCRPYREMLKFQMRFTEYNAQFFLQVQVESEQKFFIGNVPRSRCIHKDRESALPQHVNFFFHVRHGRQGAQVVVVGSHGFHLYPFRYPPCPLSQVSVAGRMKTFHAGNPQLPCLHYVMGENQVLLTSRVVQH